MSSFSSSLVVSLLALVLACGDDSSPADTGTADTGTADTGTADTGTADTGTDDTGTEDTGADDTGTEDAGADDTGAADAGTEDTGTDAGGTPCGTETCDPATEVCFECACGGPTSFACMTVPAACSEDRSCTCIGPELCTTGLMECTDRSDNHVFCDTGLD